MTARRHQSWWRQWDFLLPIGLALLLAGCATGPQQPTEAQQRLAKAQAMFAERCKTAGEKIYRTVDNVEGVFLMKLRPQEVNFGEQFEMDDPYGSDSSGDTYILNFLHGFYHQRTGDLIPGEPPRIGYSYVEAIDQRDGQRYRYTGRFEEPWQTNKAYLKGYIRFVMDRAPPNEHAPRYGVTYDDISTHEEREYWIAGSSLKVVDLVTNEIVAERVGYMIDFGQGNNSGGRSPWLMAANHACPNFQFNPLRPLTTGGGGGAGSQPGQALIFVEKVLRPTKGESNEQ